MEESDNEFDDKICGRCGISKVANYKNFHKDKDSKDGLFCWCKTCSNEYQRDKSDTISKFFSVLAGNCKNHSKIRSKKGDINKRESRSLYDIDHKLLKELYKNQDGKCYYSGIKMNTHAFATWKCSVERLNNDIGYTKDNIVLICTEFNNRNQWSRKKIEQMIKLINVQIPNKQIEESLAYKMPKRRIQSAIENKIIDGIGHKKCNGCGIFKTLENFSVNTDCKSCTSIRRKFRLNTTTGYLKKLFHSARSHSVLREDESFEIEPEDIYNLYRNQNGKCFYSGIPLVLKQKSDWQASLERKDVTKGYLKSNVCLICLEFNGMDVRKFKNRESLDEENDTSGGWSKEKFHYFLKHIIEKRDNIKVGI